MADKIYLREHLTLRPFVPDDKPNLIRYLNDPTIYRNTQKIPSPYTEADADWWIHHVREIHEQQGIHANLAISHDEHGVIGGIGCFLHTGIAGHCDEIGYWLAEPFRGQGIATEAVQVFCNWLFDNRPSLVRIEAKVYTHNPASARVLEKAGFQREGLARKLVIKDGAYIDAILLSRLREGS